MATSGNGNSEFQIVGIGGSAGAIGAFRSFFRNVPADSGMAYVVILHLSPDHESKLAQVLQSASSIPVTQVTESTLVEPNQVYVIPPNRSLSMSHGMLIVSEVTGFEGRRAPIDLFFRTLADQHGSQAVSIVMSGTGSDGSMGLRRVKEYNGLVIAQDPSEAQFDEMPRNAIATGLTDLVVRAADMPQRIIHFRDQLRRIEVSLDQEDRASNDEQALVEIFTVLRVRTGHDFTNYKRATVLRRIERRLGVTELATLPSYAKFIREHPEEPQALLRDLLISVTNFFRDHEAFEALEKTVIPKLFEGKGSDDHLRVWTAGCATGEEAYSIAMLFAEHSALSSSGPTIQIFATDLDERAIARARSGFYLDADTADVSTERLRRFFVKEQDGYRIRRELREMVLFAHHNLIKDPPFSHVDLVSCRNLLIYLNRTAQERAMEVLHFAMKPGAYLMLGTSESTEATSNLFTTVDKEQRIYQSRGIQRAIPLSAAPRQAAPALEGLPSRPIFDVRLTDPRKAERFGPIDLHQRLLEEYAPPSVVVDEDYNILHLSARAGRYLEFGAGEASLNLLNVVRQELHLELRSGLLQAGQLKATVESGPVEIQTGEHLETVKLVVRPASGDGGTRGLFLVMFEPSAAPAIRNVTTSDLPAVRQIEEELVSVKSEMRSAVERYETQAEEFKAANEELQAINEELRSAGEELETSQEELQSLNEELQTVNEELKIKIEELSNANNDMRNLMSSTEIGTIFLDRSLRVKLFTPRVRDLFNLIPADVGRPLADITGTLTRDDLTTDLELVLDRLQPIEREVRSSDGRWHMMRLLPYRTADDRIDGVVITFLDITQRKRDADSLRERQERQAFLLTLGDRIRSLDNPQSIAATATELLGRYLGASSAFHATADRSGEFATVTGAWTNGIVAVATGCHRIADLAGGEDYRNARVHRVDVIQGKDAAPVTGPGQAPTPTILGIPILKDGRLVSIVEVQSEEPRVWTDSDADLICDLGKRIDAEAERRASELALRASEERYRTLFNSMDEGFLLADVAFDSEGKTVEVRYAEANPAALRMLGKNVVGLTLGKVDETFEHHWYETFGRVAATGAAVRQELWAEQLKTLFEFYAFRVGDSRRVAVVFNDVTERRSNEDELRRSREELEERVSERTRQLQEASRQVEIERQRLSDVFEQSPILFAVASEPAHVFQIANDAYLKSIGLPRDEVIGRTLRELFPEGKGAEWIDSWDAVYTTGAPRSFTEVPMMFALDDGAPPGETWWNVTLQPLRDSSGTVIAVVSHGLNVTGQVVSRHSIESLNRDRTRLLREIVEAQEAERRKIARELHDEMGQHITALKVSLESLEAPQATRERLTALLARIDEAIDRLAVELRPATLDDVGLVAAIEHLLDSFMETSGIKVDLATNITDQSRMPVEIETTVYRVLQEALTNVTKHAAAQSVSVVVNGRGGELQMIIEDDGGGFDEEGVASEAAANTRFGLLGIRERVRSVGGEVSIETSPGKGTSLYIRLPMTPVEKAH